MTRVTGHRPLHCNSEPGEGDGGYHPEPPPENGMYGLQTLSLFPRDQHESSGRSPRAYSHHPAPLKLDLPQFDRENPKARRLKSEVYFRVCLTHPDLWISVATMYFMGSIVLWLQSTQAHTRCANWEEFVEAVYVQFGREEF